jgi:hypothetical protein
MKKFIFLVLALSTALGLGAQSASLGGSPSISSVAGLTVNPTLTAPVNIGIPVITDTGVGLQITGSQTGYFQSILQNTNAGTGASADYIVNNNLGTATTYYGDFGINSSAFTGSGNFNAPSATYLYSNSGDLAIGTTTSNAIHFIVGSPTAADAMSISSAGLLTVANAATFSSTINGDTFTTGSYTLTGGAAKTLTFNNSLTLAGTDGTTMTFPATSATVARTDAANTFTGASSTTSWSMTTPVIAGGLTASGSGANDFSASTGTFKTSTGSVTIGTGTATFTGPAVFNGTATTAPLTVTSTAKTSGVLPDVQITAAADTGLTAATTVPVLQTTGATRTWATTGTVADQYEYHFVADTLASASASQTFTVASTLDISAPPIQGTNAILSQPWALDVEAGPSNFGGTAYTFSTNPTTPVATGVNIPSATTTFQTSEPATVAALYQGIPTYSAASGTITTAATNYIAGQPTASTLAITNDYALDVASGQSILGGAYTYGANPSGATTFGTTLTLPAYTTTVTGTNTATSLQGIYMGAPTFTDSSAGAATDIQNVLMVGPAAVAGSLTTSRAHSLVIVDSTTTGTNSGSSNQGALVVTNTIGNATTSVGIGGGRVNASGQITCTTLSNQGKESVYNNVNTAGWGHPAIYASGRVTGQTGAAAAFSTYTVGAADGSFIVSANINVTASTTNSFTCTCTYTDETNTSRTLTMNFSSVTGTFLTTITNALGVGAYEGVPLHIRAKASTAITFATVGTFTSVTYNAEGIIQQIN